MKKRTLQPLVNQRLNQFVFFPKDLRVTQKQERYCFLLDLNNDKCNDATSNKKESKTQENKKRCEIVSQADVASMVDENFVANQPFTICDYDKKMLPLRVEELNAFNILSFIDSEKRIFDIVVSNVNREAEKITLCGVFNNTLFNAFFENVAQEEKHTPKLDLRKIIGEVELSFITFEKLCNDFYPIIYQYDFNLHLR